MATPAPKRRPRQLSARDIRFCQLHVERGRRHAYSCWIDAGFPPRATRNATDQAVRLLLSNPQIVEYCDHLRKVAADAARVTTEEIVAGIRAIATADRRKLHDDKGRILLPHEWPDDLEAAIETIESKELLEPVPGQKGKKRLKGHARKVKFANRLAAWAKLAEIKGLTGASKVETGKAAAPPLVVGGDADPGNL